MIWHFLDTSVSKTEKVWQGLLWTVFQCGLGLLAGWVLWGVLDLPVWS